MFSRMIVPFYILLSMIVWVLYLNWTNKMCMYTSIFRKRFIIRDWLTWLWRLRSPQTCSRQAGDQGGQWCKFQFKSQQAWNPRRADVSISVQRQETTNAQLSQAALIEGGSAFFSLCMPSTDWMPHTRGRAILCNLQIQMFISSPSSQTYPE